MSQQQEAIALMYKALMQVGMVSSIHLGRDGAMLRVQKIAEDALRTMNVEHTKLVQKALGIGK